MARVWRDARGSFGSLRGPLFRSNLRQTLFFLFLFRNMKQRKAPRKTWQRLTKQLSTNTIWHLVVPEQFTWNGGHKMCGVLLPTLDSFLAKWLLLLSLSTPIVNNINEAFKDTPLHMILTTHVDSRFRFTFLQMRSVFWSRPDYLLPQIHKLKWTSCSVHHLGGQRCVFLLSTPSGVFFAFSYTFRRLNFMTKVLATALTLGGRLPRIAFIGCVMLGNVRSPNPVTFNLPK